MSNLLDQLYIFNTYETNLNFLKHKGLT